VEPHVQLRNGSRWMLMPLAPWGARADLGRGGGTEASPLSPAGFSAVLSHYGASHSTVKAIATR
jgi:hypothetical protein